MKSQNRVISLTSEMSLWSLFISTLHIHECPAERQRVLVQLLFLSNDSLQQETLTTTSVLRDLMLKRNKSNNQITRGTEFTTEPGQIMVKRRGHSPLRSHRADCQTLSPQWFVDKDEGRSEAAWGWSDIYTWDRQEKKCPWSCKHRSEDCSWISQHYRRHPTVSRRRRQLPGAQTAGGQGQRRWAPGSPHPGWTPPSPRPLLNNRNKVKYWCAYSGSVRRRISKQSERKYYTYWYSDTHMQTRAATQSRHREKQFFLVVGLM